MKIIRLADGSIVYPSKLQPPDAIEGYTVDPLNPWRFFPSWVKCDHRQLTRVRLPCGKYKNCESCAIQGGKLISKSDCDTCTLEPKCLTQ